MHLFDVPEELPGYADRLPGFPYGQSGFANRLPGFENKTVRFAKKVDGVTNEMGRHPRRRQRAFQEPNQSALIHLLVERNFASPLKGDFGSGLICRYVFGVCQGGRNLAWGVPEEWCGTKIFLCFTRTPNRSQGVDLRGSAARDFGQHRAAAVKR